MRHRDDDGSGVWDSDPRSYKYALGYGVILSLFVLVGIFAEPLRADVASIVPGVKEGSEAIRYEGMVESFAFLAPWVSLALVILVLAAKRYRWAGVIEYLASVEVHDGERGKHARLERTDACPTASCATAEDAQIKGVSA